jgi:hypothetical protein
LFAANLTKCVKNATESCQYVQKALMAIANATTIKAGVVFDVDAAINTSLAGLTASPPQVWDEAL